MMASRPQTFEEALDERLAECRAVMIERQKKYGCVTPGHRVLTADLRWVPVESLRVGDKLLAIEEKAPPRKQRRWQFATVTAIGTGVAECYRIHLDTGESLVATGDHPWLTGVMGQCWVKTTNLNYNGHKTILPKLLRVWETDTSYEAGWLAGFFDGEGSLSNSAGISGLQVSAHQRPGPVVDQAVAYLRKLGFECSAVRERQDGLIKIHVRGGHAETLRFLGTVRPVRLLNRFLNDINLPAIRRKKNGINARVLAVEPVGPREIVTLETSSHTYLVEGYASHNSNNIKALGLRGVLDRIRNDKLERISRVIERQDLRRRCLDAGMPREIVDQYLPEFQADYSDESLRDALIDVANYAVIALMLLDGVWGLPLAEE